VQLVLQVLPDPLAKQVPLVKPVLLAKPALLDLLDNLVKLDPLAKMVLQLTRDALDQRVNVAILVPLVKLGLPELTDLLAQLAQLAQLVPWVAGSILKRSSIKPATFWTRILQNCNGLKQIFMIQQNLLQNIPRTTLMQLVHYMELKWVILC
jgi:hypothetical protein